jgi:hypothetical protein
MEAAMAIKSIWCPVLQTHVTCVTDLEGKIVKVVCCEYDEATRTCRMKQAATRVGPISHLLLGASENTLADHSLRCTIG